MFFTFQLILKFSNSHILIHSVWFPADFIFKKLQNYLKSSPKMLIIRCCLETLNFSIEPSNSWISSFSHFSPYLNPETPLTTTSCFYNLSTSFLAHTHHHFSGNFSFIFSVSFCFSCYYYPMTCDSTKLFCFFPPKKIERKKKIIFFFVGKVPNTLSRFSIDFLPKYINSIYSFFCTWMKLKWNEHSLVFCEDEEICVCFFFAFFISWLLKYIQQ